MELSQSTFEELAILEYYGELSADEKVRFEKEKSLPENREILQSVQSSLSMLSNVEREEPNEDFWTALEYNIHSAVRKEEKPAPAVQQPQQQSWWQQIVDSFFAPAKIGYTLSGGLACVLIGLLVGAKFQPEFIGAKPAVSDVAASSEKMTEFLKRSQIYLLNVIDKNGNCPECVTTKEEFNKLIAQQLLHEAAEVRKQAGDNPELKRMMTDLEFVLNTMVTMDSNTSTATVDAMANVANSTLMEVSSQLKTKEETIKK